MLLYHQQDHVEKMYFEIVFNLSLHQVEDKATCQTQFYIFNFFLSPLWRLGPKIFMLFCVWVFPLAMHSRSGHCLTNFCKEARDWSIIHVDEFLGE